MSDEAIIIGAVKFVHALIELPCSKCRQMFLQMERAPVLPDGRIEVKAPVPADRIRLCNDCIKCEREQEVSEHRKSLEQRRWAKGNAPKLRR